MDFEALLIHTRQEVALDLKSFMISIFQSFKVLNILKVIGVFFCTNLLIIELIKTEQIIKADNLVILKSSGMNWEMFFSLSRPLRRCSLPS